jgi:hypothetical protein
MNVSNSVFYKSLRTFLLLGPNFCGPQASASILMRQDDILNNTDVRCARHRSVQIRYSVKTTKSD